MAHTVRSVPLSIFKDPGPPDSLLSCCDPPFRCHGLYAMGIFRFRLPIMENISIGFSSFCFNCVRSHWDQPIFAWVELKLQISLKITKPSYNVQISSWFKLCSISLRSAHFCMSWVEALDKFENYKTHLQCSNKFSVSIVFDLTEISPILHELSCTKYIIRLSKFNWIHK